jgi:hypothetical protein
MFEMDFRSHASGLRLVYGGRASTATWSGRVWAESRGPCITVKTWKTVGSSVVGEKNSIIWEEFNIPSVQDVVGRR